MENVTRLFTTPVHLQKLALLLPQSLLADNFLNLPEHAWSYSKYTGLDNYINNKKKKKQLNQLQYMCSFDIL